MCVSDLTPCMPVHHVFTSGLWWSLQDPLEVELQMVAATMWVWELNPGLP